MGDFPMNKNPILEIRGLRKEYHNINEKDTILENLTFTIKEKELLCILGQSGCGKTTLLRCIAGFEDYKGEIAVNGKVIKKPNMDRIMVFQDFNQLFPWKTVEKNIQYALKKKGIRDTKELCMITDNYLRKVNLDGYQKYYPYQLSGGMKQRVAIARALALKPEIILMDEPFAALDAITRNKLQEELQRMFYEENCTILFVTHNIQEAIVLGTRIILMGKNGRLVIDKKNGLEKPVTPASKGYAELWKELHQALEEE